MRQTEFEVKVLAAVKRISRGKVKTYKQIAKIIGRPKASRAVGNVLAKNPNLVKIPCHRVIKSSGQVGNYQKGSRQKIELLLAEGIKIKNKRVLNFDKD